MLTKQHAVVRPLGQVKKSLPSVSFSPVYVGLVQSSLFQLITGVPCIRWRLKAWARPASATASGSWASEAEAQAIRATTSNTPPATYVADDDRETMYAWVGLLTSR